MTQRWTGQSENPTAGQQSQQNLSKPQRVPSGSKLGAQYAQQLKKQVQASSQANNIDPQVTKQYMQNYLSDHQSGSSQMPVKTIKHGVQSLGQTQIQPNSQIKPNFAASTSALSSTTPGPLTGQLTQLGAGSSAIQMANYGSENKPNSRNQINRNAQNALRSDNNLNKTQMQGSQGNLQGLPSNQKASTHGAGEIPSLDRRKERTSSSSNKQKVHQPTGQSGTELPPSSINRTMIRPSSKSRKANPSPGAENRDNLYKVKPAISGAGRGSSPGATLQKPVTNINVAGTNLQNYFDNQIPQLQVGSSKNLPRKKRPQKEQSQANDNENDVVNRQGAGNYPPMSQDSSSTQNLLNNQQLQSTSPVRSVQPTVAKPAVQRPQPQQNQQSNISVKQKPNITRPSAPQHVPALFDETSLFLNVESQYNSLLMQMIQPNRDQFEFDGTIQYVMNASELSNQALAKLLYESSAPQPPSIPQKHARSRNVADQSLSKGNAAGQSTSSFFNTKKNFQASTLQAASQSNSVPTRVTDQSFFENIREEIQMFSDSHIKSLMPDYQPAKFSAKRNGIVAAYGANTNQGIVRNYNEDRVAIILNIMKPKSKQYIGEEWPKCSFFGIYDGHGGNVCADFLRDYLHQFIIKDQNFPKEPIKAIREGFKEAEKLFLEFAEGQQFEVGDIDRSGSCAIVALIIDDMCYIGNTGDSRACMSVDGGKTCIGLSNDHKPTDDIEMERILGNNGRIYQNSSIVNVQQPGGGLQSQVVLGPHRVFPGRLSVCRTFGDIEAKLPKLDGNPKVVIADPDVVAFKIDRSRHDFIVIGCDGIFDKLENRDCVHFPWQTVLQSDLMRGKEPFSNPIDEETKGNQKQGKTQDERRHKLAGLAVDSILKSSAVKRSCDNITTVVIVFDNFYRKLDELQGKGPYSNDKEIIEEIQFDPEPLVAPPKREDNNVIYIENEDILEDDENNTTTGDLGFKTNEVRGNNRYGQQVNESQTSTGSLLIGETGAVDNSYSNQNQNTWANNTNSQQQLSDQKAGIEQAYMNPDQLLSEIAEEDSVSMVSDRPKRFNQKQQSDSITPKDPITNSFIGSIRVSTTQLNSKLNTQHDEPMHSQSEPTFNSTGKSTKDSRYDHQNTEPYSNQEETKQAKLQKKNLQQIIETTNMIHQNNGQPVGNSSKSRQQNSQVDDPNSLMDGLPSGQKSNTYSHPQMQYKSANILPNAQLSNIKPMQNDQIQRFDNTGIESGQMVMQPKKRRSSNQNAQRPGANQQQQHSSMPPHSQTQLAPLAQANLASTSQQVLKGYSTQSRSQGRPNDKESGQKKSKTQQPGKLVEIFRQVDQPNISSGIQPNSVTHTHSQATQQYLQKGAITSTNNQSIRGQNNPLATHGAQVHNIQIKPISANKRRVNPQGHQNLLQAQQAQQQSSSYVSVPNILNNRQKERSQTNLALTAANNKSASDLGHKSNQLISQYLTQVNHNNSMNQQNINNSVNNVGSAYASKSGRNSNSGKNSSLGAVSRAQRAYNNLGPNKTQQISGSSTQQLGGILPISTRQAQNNNAYVQGTQQRQQNRSNSGVQDEGVKSRNSGQGNSVPKWQSLSSNQINSNQGMVHSSSQGKKKHNK